MAEHATSLADGGETKKHSICSELLGDIENIQYFNDLVDQLHFVAR